ncbi:bacteriorhodopsin-like [Tessaracoccus antarcticus]|uniref:Xanthorhodopsin n=1 Tax=Tessaracoccus antarcticus TaxID=2479848 RepID=A0A3M0G769_9ACTN|nr:bacteriorhodopsin-like [Tessaracoccus antarcticus]RMB59977.1 xanthorhodopsin [Tessaracoccus antarcticus]
MVDLPDISSTTFSVIENAFSLVFASFLGAAVFFLVSRRDVARAYRTSVTVCGVVVVIAAYHYFRIFESFKSAYGVAGGVATPSGEIFNEAYRYMDWIITVPLLVVELILVMGLVSARRRSLLYRLVPAAFAMIALGYPGELSTDVATQWLWWGLAMIPFVYILFVLFGEVSKVIQDQPIEVQPLFRVVRVALVATWMFYPIAYLFPILLGNTGLALALENIGYAVADLTAKAGYGLVIFLIAKRKSELERLVPSAQPVVATS